MDDRSLHAAMAQAQKTGNWSAVIEAYISAADGVDGAAFYLTHAYVHALEAGDARAGGLKARLIALGADVADQV